MTFSHYTFTNPVYLCRYWVYIRQQCVTYAEDRTMPALIHNDNAINKILILDADKFNQESILSISSRGTER